MWDFTGIALALVVIIGLLYFFNRRKASEAVYDDNDGPPTGKPEDAKKETDKAKDKDKSSDKKQDEEASKGWWRYVTGTWKYAKYPLLAFLIYMLIWFIVWGFAEYQARAFLGSKAFWLSLIPILFGAWVIDAEVRSAAADKKADAKPSYVWGWIFISLGIVGGTLNIISNSDHYADEMAQMKQKDYDKSHPPATPEEQQRQKIQAQIDAANATAAAKEKEAADARAELKRSQEETEKKVNDAIAKALGKAKEKESATTIPSYDKSSFTPVGVTSDGGSGRLSSPAVARSGGVDNTGLEGVVPGGEMEVPPDRFVTFHVNPPPAGIEIDGWRYEYVYKSAYIESNARIKYRLDNDPEEREFPDPKDPDKKFLGNYKEIHRKSADNRTLHWKYWWVLRKIKIDSES